MAEPINEQELAAIAARAEAATRGPWYAVSDASAGGLYATLYGPDRPEHGDVFPDGWLAERIVVTTETGGNPAFIAAARTDVPALVAEVRRLRGLLVDLAGPVEAFYWAMADSSLLAPDLRATLATALHATRAAIRSAPPAS